MVVGAETFIWNQATHRTAYNTWVDDPRKIPDHWIQHQHVRRMCCLDLWEYFSSLQRCRMSVMVSQLTGQSSVCLFSILFWLTSKKHQTSSLLALSKGDPPVTGGVSLQRASKYGKRLQFMMMFSLICTWINGWVNNRDAGDLRRHRAHYDVTVMPTAWATR